MTMNRNQIGTEELALAAGGLVDGPVNVGWACDHDHTVRTGIEREDSRFFFWSKHQHEYHCNDCGLNIWYDDD